MKIFVVVVAAAPFDDNKMEFEGLKVPTATFLSADELSLTISATENPNAKEKFSTGNRRSDPKTWLSAALGNQDTCQDGFDGTNSFVKNIIGGSLRQVTSLVIQVLGMVAQGPSNNFGDLYGENDKFPFWMKV
ncbi:Pectinesterase/pectinesterase inhibitor PPE8B [Thalictrum thalictroides]|uniref:Pectinesterase/pectinesterase inhibitor PPE8B n=1 Tax=Thalictrum thalictroides TaxID=46969 RepID=A0A7J6WLB4_THATH|nr:Pectinesterase/pectinesterase inhibitor PPE8B [Thalictrum thalictroides]